MTRQILVNADRARIELANGVFWNAMLAEFRTRSERFTASEIAPDRGNPAHVTRAWDEVRQFAVSGEYFIQLPRAGEVPGVRPGVLASARAFGEVREWDMTLDLADGV